MIDNDPSELISSVARDIGVWEFLISPIVRKGVPYFIQDEKVPILSQANEGEEKIPWYKALEEI